MAKPAIPSTLDDLTPEWLTGVLRGCGALHEARVTGVTSEALGEGEGFVGSLARLHLSLDRPEPTAPRTVVAKLPTTVAENRAAGELLGAYEREVLFYQELAGRIPFRTARCYHAEMDANPAAEHGPAIVAFVDRLPSWLTRVLMAFFRWVAARSSRRYILLLEDLAPATVGDQVAGSGAGECAPVLRSLARAQAELWESPILDRYYWVGRLDIAPRLTHQVFRDSRAAFEERYREELLPWAEGTLDWLDTNGIALIRALHGEAPHTLLHGDFRLDNLFFRDGAREPIAIDWQGAGRGAAAFDAAYFLSGSLDTAVETGEERALLRLYHQELVDAGVEGYGYDECERDYERSLLLLLHRLVTIDTMDLGGERGVSLVDLWVARLLRRINDVDLDRALPRAAA